MLEVLPPGAGAVFDVESSVDDAGRPVATTTGTLLASVCERVLGGRPALVQPFDPAVPAHVRAALPSLAFRLLTRVGSSAWLAVAATTHLDVQVHAVHAGVDAVVVDDAPRHVRSPAGDGRS